MLMAHIPSDCDKVTGFIFLTSVLLFFFHRSVFIDVHGSLENHFREVACYCYIGIICLVDGLYYSKKKMIIAHMTGT